MQPKPNRFTSSILILLTFVGMTIPLGSGTQETSCLSLADVDEGFYLHDLSTSFSISMASNSFFAKSDDSNRFEDITPVFRIGFWGIFLFSVNAFGDLAQTSLQTGMNEHGLCMGLIGLPFLPTNNDPEREPWWNSVTRPLDSCTNVSEAVNWILSHNLEIFGDCMPYQIHLADASGNAVIISAGLDGELHCTYKNTSHIVCSNFNLQHPEIRYGAYPCSRYDTTNQMLSVIESESELNRFALRDILDAVDIEDSSNKTVSYIFDTDDQVAYLYYRHDYDRVLTLNISLIQSTLEPDDVLECNITELYDSGMNFTLDERPVDTTPVIDQHIPIIITTGVISVGVALPVLLALYRRRRRG